MQNASQMACINGEEGLTLIVVLALAHCWVLLVQILILAIFIRPHFALLGFRVWQ